MRLFCWMCVTLGLFLLGLFLLVKAPVDMPMEQATTLHDESQPV